MVKSSIKTIANTMPYFPSLHRSHVRVVRAVIVIVGSRPCCSYCCGVLVALGAKDVLAMLLTADVLTLLLMIKDCCRSTFCCCVVVRTSRLPLLLPLSDHIPVVAAATVVFLLHLEGGRHGEKDVDRERVNVVDTDRGLLRETNKHKHTLDCNCN